MDRRSTDIVTYKLREADKRIIPVDSKSDFTVQVSIESITCKIM